MTQTFFSIGRQGNRTWKHYFKGGLTIFGLTFAITVVALIVLIVGTEFSLETDTEIWPYLAMHPFQGLLFAGAIMLGLFTGLWVTMKRIHQRPFLTLINPQGSLNGKRIAQGFGLWLCIQSAVSAVAYVINPSRYDIIFVATQWVPWAIAYSLVMLPAIFIVGILFYGYILQGVGLIIKRPIWLLTTWCVVFGLLIHLDKPEYWFLSLFQLAFYCLLIYQDDGLALLLGVSMAEVLGQGVIIGLSDALVITQPLISGPTVLRLNSLLPPIANLLIAIAKASTLYFLCFHKLPAKPTTTPR